MKDYATSLAVAGCHAKPHTAAQEFFIQMIHPRAW